MTDYLVAMAVAALSGAGVGGGGLFVIYLSLVIGTEQREAQLSNLAFFIFAASSALIIHMKNRRLDGRLIAVLSLSGVAGGIVGSHVASILPSSALKTAFGFMLIASSVYTVIRTKASKSL